MRKPNGVILYRGPSLIDGSPIVCIAVGLKSKSKNGKTGNMLQTYILRARIDPISAVKRGHDFAICANCKHRGTAGKGRTCYVNLGQGPLAVYRAYKRGKYPVAPDVAAIGASRVVRLGTYGDPAAVPARIWESLVSQSIGHTGYTHQWRVRPELRTLCMASTDNAQETQEAQSLGWRTFHVQLRGPDELIKNEKLCPASAQAGKKLTCNQCLSCSGADGRKGSIYIPAHGGFAVMAAVRKLMAIPITIKVTT